jgi:type VI protein secretion system component VasK
MPQIVKDWLRRLFTALGYTVVCMGFVLIGLYVLSQAKVMPDADFKNFTIGVASSIAGAGFVFFMVFAWGMDKNSDRLQKMEKEQAQQRQLIEDFKTEIHALNTTNSALLQQLVDKANQPTTNALPTPANLTNMPDITTKLASPDQAVMASNGHVSNGS